MVAPKFPEMQTAVPDYFIVTECYNGEHGSAIHVCNPLADSFRFGRVIAHAPPIVFWDVFIKPIQQ